MDATPAKITPTTRCPNCRPVASATEPGPTAAGCGDLPMRRESCAAGAERRLRRVAFHNQRGTLQPCVPRMTESNKPTEWATHRPVRATPDRAGTRHPRKARHPPGAEPTRRARPTGPGRQPRPVATAIRQGRAPARSAAVEYASRPSSRILRERARQCRCSLVIGLSLWIPGYSSMAPPTARR